MHGGGLCRDWLGLIYGQRCFYFADPALPQKARFLMKTSNPIDLSIQLLTHIQTSPEKLQWCREYSAYHRPAGQEKLLADIRHFIDNVYGAGLVISNYSRVATLWNLDESEMDRASIPWLSRQPYLSVLAAIAWHFRRDHFIEGSLINTSIASGALLRLFLRLKEISPTPGPAVTLRELIQSNCSNIPEEPGVYWVLAPEGFSVRFHQRPYHPRAKLYPAELLQAKLTNCNDKQILYIGKAQGKKGLRQRVRQYMNYGQGKSNIHQGGRAIWQIEAPELLLLGYEVCQQADVREHQLLAQYQAQNHSYPLANWRG